MRRRAVLGLLMAVGLTGSAAVSDAIATFPGRSGELMYPYSNPYGKVIDGESGVEAFGTGMKVRRSVFRCNYFFTNVGSCFAFHAAAAPDGKRVAVVVSDIVDSGPRYRYRLVVLAPNGDELQSGELDRPIYDIAWAPTGDMLLGTRYGGTTGNRWDGPPHVVLIGADGRTLGPVTGDGASDADWSVKGDIAYVQSGEIWITQLGETPRRVTTAGGNSPSWAPSGRALAFSRDNRIWTVDADGTGERRLADVEATEPAWSPDGRYISFRHVPDRGYAGLWTMRADGRCPHEVLRERGYLGYWPSFWRPLARSNAPSAYRFACLSRGERRRRAKKCIRKPRVAERRCLAALRRAMR